MGKSGKYTDIKNNKVFIYLYTIPLLPIRISDTQAEGLTSKRELRDSEPRTESKTHNFSPDPGGRLSVRLGGCTALAAFAAGSTLVPPSLEWRRYSL